jgi:phosphoserine phosphatase RsbU/P
MAHLLVENGRFRGRSFPLRPAETVLGRNAYLREILSDDLGISREHVAIRLDHDGYALRDLGSRRGTWVNGMPLEGRHLLRDRDRIQLAGMTLLFFHEAPCGESRASLSSSAAWKVSLSDDVASTLERQVDVGDETSTPAGGKDFLTALRKMIGALTSTDDPDQILESLLQAFFQVFPKAQRGFVGTLGKDSTLLPAAVSFRQEGPEAQVPVSRHLANLAIGERKATLVRDAITDSKLDGSESVFANEIRSVMCVPLFDAGGEPLGIVQLDTPFPDQHFDQDDLQLLADLAPQAAFALKFRQLHNRVVDFIRLEHDLQVAKSVQERLMPQSDPAIDGYTFFRHYRAARVLGGDFYDFRSLPDGRLGIVLADVEGKGIPAALYVAKLATELRHLLEEEEHLPRLVQRLNDSFTEEEGGRFVTLLLLVLDPRSHTVLLVNAGHWDPVLRRASGEVECVGGDTRGRPVGVFPGETYNLCQFSLQPDEALVIFSDGFTDATNGHEEPFGHDRVLQAIRTAKTGDIGPTLVDCVGGYIAGAEQTDDMSLIVIRRV